MTPVRLEPLCGIPPGYVALARLHRGWLPVTYPGDSPLGGSGLRRDPAPPTVVADPPFVDVPDDGPVHVDVPDVDADVADGAVVVELVSSPAPARVAVAEEIGRASCRERVER